MGKTLVLKRPLPIHWTSAEDFRFHDGHMLPPCKPGLGVEINEALVIERSASAVNWRNPVWRHADGSVAEW